MGHQAIGGSALRGMDGANPTWPDMPIGEAGEVERFVLAVLALDGDAAALRIDPDDAGDIAVVAPRAAVVAGELDAVAGAQLLFDLDERFGLVAAPSCRRPGDGLALRGGERDRARLGVDALHPVGASPAQPLFATAAPERDDLTECVAGGAGRLGKICVHLL